MAYDGCGEKQPVYLGICFCDDLLQDEFETLGHGASCLRVVPFYHVSNNLAIAVLEQICDERQLVPRLLRVGKRWIVTLSAVDAYSDTEIVRVEDKSLALAICLALGELREEQKTT